MTNETVKKTLLTLDACDEDFSVIMTGKESKKVNGLYKPATKEILLHNKNFKTDNELLYTAIHEYAHHLISTRNGVPQKGAVAHDVNFWAVFDTLLDAAVEKGIYQRTRSEKLSSLITEARECDEQIVKMKQKLGNILSTIAKLSVEEGVRYEDVLSHDLNIDKVTAKKEQKLGMLGEVVDGLGQDEASVVLKAKSKNEISTIKCNLAGKTLNQTKKLMVKEPSSESIDRYIKEKEKVERMIVQLNQRLDFLTGIIEGSS